MPERGRKLILHTAVIGGYCALAIILTYPMVLHFTTKIPIAHQIPGWAPGDGDPWHSLWVLWFGNYSLLEVGRSPFATDLLFYPRGMDLGYLRLIILPVLLSLPLVQLLGLIATYNLLILLAFTVGGYSCFLLVRHLTRSSGGAFVAGLVFAFSPYQMIHSFEHLSLVLSAAWLPLYTLFLWQCLRQGRTANAALAASCLLGIMLSNPYYAGYLMLWTGLCVGFHCWRSGPAAQKLLLMKRVGLLFTFDCAVSLPVIVPALLQGWPDTILYAPLADANSWSADLMAFFLPSPYHPLWGGLVQSVYDQFTGNLFEQVVYIGYSVLILAVVAVIQERRGETRFWLISALTFFILALGPFLHIHGRDTFTVDGMPLTMPLPFLLLYFVPVLGGARVASRFAVMLMLCLAVLVGYGVRGLIERLSGGQRRVWAPGGILVGLSAVILADFLSVPLPMLSATIPQVYATIAEDGRADGSLGDIPFKNGIAKYLYYQTAHRKKLLSGFGPRLHPSLGEYAQTFPLMNILRDPDRFLDQRSRWTPEDALRLIDFFNLDAIVIHREYLRPQTVEPLRQFLMEVFPVRRMATEGKLMVLWMNRDHNSQVHWRPEDYRWDFGAAETPPFLAQGWSTSEAWGEMTVAWSQAKASRLWVYFPRRTAAVMELRLLPFTFAESPLQGIKVYVNGEYVREVELTSERWQTYRLHLPHRYLKEGINTFRFLYRYTASPAEVLPDSTDARMLAVAFDFIAFHPE